MKRPENYRPLLTTQNAKTVKGEPLGYLTGILYLAPARESGLGNLCPMASKGCAASCLFTAGRGRFPQVYRRRMEKTRFWFEDREAFMASLSYDIQRITAKARKRGLRACFRLNGTSDIQWEKQKYQRHSLFDWFPDIQFYDYTKIWTRFNKPLPDNYHLSFSRSESNQKHVEHILEHHPKTNVMVVFKDPPKTWMRRKVVSADEHDLRFLDPPGVICSLKPKGKARYDTSGFVL